VVEECLRHLATIPDTEVQVTVTVEPGGAAAVRVTTPGRGLLPVEEESWLVRSRARAALAGGSLSCGPTDGGTFVELQLG
jgi:hypothetical protein